jgi:hypothetical protein
MLEQILAMLQSNPDAAAMALAQAGAVPPTMQGAGGPGPMPVPPARGTSMPPSGGSVDPGMSSEEMQGLMMALSNVQGSEAPRVPTPNVQSVPPTFGNALPASTGQMMAQLLMQRQAPQSGLAAALAGR